MTRSSSSSASIRNPPSAGPSRPDPHPDSRAPAFGSFAGLETGRARVRYDQQVRTAYGWRWLAWEDYAVRDGMGRLVEVQSVGRDITERKALEEALTEARDRAEAGSRAKSGFLATMSHEIRTPMNGVLGMARLLMETELRSEQRSYVQAIEQSGEALLALIGDILDFSKIESGMMRYEEDQVELRPLIERVIELQAPRAHSKDVEIVAIIAPRRAASGAHRRRTPDPGDQQSHRQRRQVHREGRRAHRRADDRGPRAALSALRGARHTASVCRPKSARRSSRNSSRPIPAMRANSAARGWGSRSASA